jgi:hypothetical protein
MKFTTWLRDAYPDIYKECMKTKKGISRGTTVQQNVYKHYPEVHEQWLAIKALMKSVDKVDEQPMVEGIARMPDGRRWLIRSNGTGWKIVEETK